MAKIPKCSRLSRPALWSTFGRTKNSWTLRQLLP